MEKKTFLSGIAAFSVVGLAVTGVVVAGNSKSSNVASMNVSATTAPTVAAIPTSFKDGLYKAIGKYKSPDGIEKLDVTVTVASNKISDTTVVPEKASYTSQRYQGWFLDAYKTMVVGKDLSKVKLGNVSGSTLTPVGYNDAITQIQQQAKA
jgi:uncharacterized protein with FMN-binding domain